MPIKDSLHKYKCKCCDKEFVMFKREDGSLVTFPDNYPWPIHGELELVDHFRVKHGDKYSLIKIFFPVRNELIGFCYKEVS